jgi:hypothetical protein
MAQKLYANPDRRGYILGGMVDSCATADTRKRVACYKTSTCYEHLAHSSYGFGHTNLRQPGDLRGTAVGIKGRFRMPVVKGGDA